MSLTAGERRTLEAVCGTFFPRLDPPKGAASDAAHYATGASDVALADAVAQAIAGLSPRQATELRLFLRCLDMRWFMLLAAGTAHAFSALPLERRETALLAMARHPLALVRTGFQALRRLSSFLFYSVVDASGTNPVHASLGYLVPATHPGRVFLAVMTAPRRSWSADACVIGSGAGGSVVAAKLAEAGKSVIVIDAGAADQASDFDQREIVGMQRLYLNQGTTATRDLGIAIFAGSSIGGGTTINWQTSLRTPDFIRDEWAELSGIPDFAGGRFTRSLDAVCTRLGVGTAESTQNANNTPLRRGCEALGYSWSVIPRNARGCDLAQCGFCVFGCRVGGKQSAATTYLVDAQRNQRTTIVSSCRATALRIDRGRVTGVYATHRDEGSGKTTQITIDAPLVVVAAGALETPALLMRTGIEHEQLGRNLFLHPTSAVGGVYPEVIQGWIGAPQTVLCDAFARAHGTYGFRLETPPIHPGLFGLAVQWTGARAYRDEMARLPNTSAFIALTRDRRGGSVRVDRDGNAVVRYTLEPMQRDLIRRGIEAAARVHWAAGALEVSTLHTDPVRARRADGDDIERLAAEVRRRAVDANRSQLFSAHQMGTCAMGTDARRHVCDENGAVRGVRGLYVADTSLFPASSGVNPMITVMALADMVADRITAHLRT
jgi:choline dehydrogenase-like flavoprotein